MRMFMIIFVFLLFSFVFLIINLVESRSQMMIQKRTEIQNVVEVGYSIVERFYKENQQGNMSEQQAKERALAALKDMRYGEGDYFWVNDMIPKLLCIQ